MQKILKKNLELDNAIEITTTLNPINNISKYKSIYLVIAGGFHYLIKDFFDKYKIPYLIIIPQATKSFDSQIIYHQLLKGLENENIFNLSGRPLDIYKIYWEQNSNN